MNSLDHFYHNDTHHIGAVRTINGTEASALLEDEGFFAEVSEWWTLYDKPQLNVQVWDGDHSLDELKLDYDRLPPDDWGIIVTGNLHVDLLHNNDDASPFLIVLGDLHLGQAVVCGATIHVRGALHVDRVFYGFSGEENLGTLYVEGPARVGLLLPDGYVVHLRGGMYGRLADNLGYVQDAWNTPIHIAPGPEGAAPGHVPPEAWPQ